MMRVLFTGGSSFTGAWFARALLDRGAEVVLAGRRRAHERDALERLRLDRLLPRAHAVDNAPFGSPAFLELCARHGPFDLLCLHGAEVGDHRAPDYDPLVVAARDTRGIGTVLDRLIAGGLRAVLFTGSLFEADEGTGERPLRAFSPYGVAKTVTWHLVRFACECRDLTLGKIVVGNPFGPMQKPNLCAEFVSAWLRDEVPVLRRPALLRDHAHVELLAEVYARFAFDLPERHGTLRLHPSCYAESLAAFVERLAREMRPRLDRSCRFGVRDETGAASEPRIRFNTESVTRLVPSFDYEAAWDRLARWHLSQAEEARTPERAGASA